MQDMKITNLKSQEINIISMLSEKYQHWIFFNSEKELSKDENVRSKKFGFSELKKTIETLNKTIKSMESELKDNSKEIKSMEQQLEDQNNTIVELEDNRIKSIEEKLDEHTDNIVQLQNDFKTLNGTYASR